MKITVLLDNNTFIDRYFLGEPGVSYFVEADGQRVLFDVGYSDAFLRNAQKMGIDLLSVDTVALSHGHLDHTWGLFPLIQHFSEAREAGRSARLPQLIAHPEVLRSRKARQAQEIGSLLTAEKLAAHFTMQLSREPVQLTERLWFLGEIPRVNDFEAQTTLGQVVEDGQEVGDRLPDDTALAYRTRRGLVIITGCAHAGICNIVEWAREVCGESRVVDILGGFHLLKPSERQLHGTLDYLAALGPRSLHACHCTDLGSKIALAQRLPLQEVGVGLKLEY